MQNMIQQAHVEWQNLLYKALEKMDPRYLSDLASSSDWLPGYSAIFSAFRLPLSATRYILLGESPYPRPESANGYAFWDQAVQSLWSDTGLSKAVNRATSLRNMIKMLLLARGDLSTDFSQSVIARLDKSSYPATAEQLFQCFLKKGFLLLNASLVYGEGKVPYHARQWRPFIQTLFSLLGETHPKIQLILLGRIASEHISSPLSPGLLAEHPYNISFITNPLVLDFFKPLDLLAYDDLKNNG